MACAVDAAGYSVFRLNLRDHGGSHHLNRDFFHSARINEVLGTIKAVQAFDTATPLYVIGFSLGGNFALRVGLQGPAAGLHPPMRSEESCVGEGCVSTCRSRGSP